MGSRKEEEKNEKIIRGLMKLPPNRKCFNCNSLGPQYVCTNFCTFVCVTCSGIHREFTHRVKSVSMAKFTSQEVDALQNGGNQRARETYLKHWDFQRQRLPDSSNVDKIREFMRNVYVDRRYAGAKSSEKPPRDPQSPRIQEDEIRRASSYHSFSQSPPYDYQYEDRRYGKQVAVLTRKPGSDKVRYEGKMSSIIYSPGRLSDHAYDDRFANEGSGPRISDFSVSSGGDQFKSDVQSPKFHKDIGFSSPSYRHSGSNSSEDVWSQARNTPLETNAKRDADRIHRPQRTTSLQSERNFSSLRSYNSGGLVDFFSEPVQDSGSLPIKAAGVPRPSGPTRSVSMDISKAPVASEPYYSSASSVDLFQSSAAPSQAPSVDLFQSSVVSAAPSFIENQPTQTSQPPSIDLFAEFCQQPSNETSAAPSHVPLTDLFQSSVLSEAPAFNEQPTRTFQPSSVDFFVDHSQLPPTATSTAPSQALPLDLFRSSVLSVTPSFNENQPMQTSQTSSVDFFVNHSLQPSTATSDEKSLELSVPKNEGWAAFDMPTNTQSWNAFEDSSIHLPVDAFSQGLQLHKFPSADNQFLGLRASEGSNKGGMQGIASVSRFDNHDIPSHVSGSPYSPSKLPPMGDMQPNGISCKSTNPFDYPFESDVGHNNMFLDMSSLQAALPDALLPTTFNDGIADPWLPQITVSPYISSAGQGGLSFMAAQPLSSQIQNVQAKEPVTSFGGNPFA